MAKRIVSGIFVLTALGALGVILAGALTSGEQLIVRFLTAVTVAALGLYVISDLRLQNEPSPPQSKARAEAPPTPAATSTAAYMATVTAQRSKQTRTPDGASGHTPRFQELEPVTADAASRRPLADDLPDGVPSEPAGISHRLGEPGELSGSRLVPPLPSADARKLPPHPLEGRSAPVPPVPAGPNSPARATTPIPPLSPVVDAELIYPAATLPSPDDVDGLDPGPSTIASTAFTYSGPLELERADWPPTPPPDAGEEGGSVSTDETGGADADGAEIEAADGETMPGSAEGEASDEATTTIDVRTPGEAAVDSADPSDDVDEEVTEDHPVVIATDAEPAPHPAVVTRQLEAAQYAEPYRGDLVDLRTTPPASPAPAIPVPSPDRLSAAIRAGEVQVVNSLIRKGMLSTAGPITDRDVRTMVYVAFTSNELRKLILAGGTPDGVRAGDLDLGPVELFDETRYAPLPKTVYTGRPDPGLPPVDEAFDPGSPDVAEAPVAGPVEAVETPVEAIEVLDLTDSASIPADETDPSDIAPELVEAGLAEGVSSNPGFPTPKHLYRRSGVNVRSDH